MKALFLKSIFILLVFVGFTTIEKSNIDPIKVVATYDGRDDFGYNFSYEDEYEGEVIITFETVSDKILKKYDLNDNSLKGTEFEITYKYKTIDDKEEEEEVPVLISIKELE